MPFDRGSCEDLNLQGSMQAACLVICNSFSRFSVHACPINPNFMQIDTGTAGIFKTEWRLSLDLSRNGSEKV